MSKAEKLVDVVDADNVVQAGKYLTFALADEEYGLEILQVREIIGLIDITTVPKMPDFVKGVVNLRGKIIPVIDLRLKFGMTGIEYTKETCIIVLSISNNPVGIIVDNVCEVLDIEQDSIELVPSFGMNINADFIMGMGKVENSVVLLLDIEKVMTESELALIDEINK